MADVTVKWLEQQQYVGIDSTGHGIVLSTNDERGGIGVKPSDLLLLALGGCVAVDVVEILLKKRQKLTGLEIRVSGSQQSDPPWTFQSAHVHYILRGQGLPAKAVEDAISLSHDKYCSVGATLRLAIPVTHDYEIVEEP